MVGEAGAEPSSGAPTEISQRWPGSPCGGLSLTLPLAVVAAGPEDGAGAGAGCASGMRTSGCCTVSVVVDCGGASFLQAIIPKARTSAIGRALICMINDCSGEYSNRLVSTGSSRVKNGSFSPTLCLF